LEYASDLVDIGFFGLGGDKAPVPGTAEATSRLMPDSHNARGELVDLRLTGFRKAVRPPPSRLETARAGARARP